MLPPHLCSFCGEPVSLDKELFTMLMSPSERQILSKLHRAHGRFVIITKSSSRTMVCRLREKLRDEGQSWKIESGPHGDSSYRLVKT